MNVDEILTQTFVSHESLAPDPEAELEDLLAKVNQRRRHRASRPMAVLSAAVVVGLIAAAVALIPSQPDKSPRPTGPGSSSRHSTTPPATSTQTVTPPHDAAFYTTFAPSWLPPHSTLVFQQALNQTQTLRYAATADKPNLVANIGLQPGTKFPVSSTEGTDMTVNGKAARGFPLAVRQYGYLIAIKVDTTHLITVSVISRTPGTRAIATQIAQSLQLGRHDPIHTAFTFTALPSGLDIRGITYRTGAPFAGTSYTLARAGAPNAGITVASTNAGDGKVTVGPPGAPGSPTRTEGKPFRGHSTVIQHRPGDGYDLEIGQAQPGTALLISGGPAVPLAALYRIANDVNWSP